MQFTYHPNCGFDILVIADEVYKYLIKARRHKINEKIYFRNLKDNLIYLYEIKNIDKKTASLELVSSEEKIVKNSKNLHLAWCVVDTKTVEKNISSLNELGVDKITFIYCEYSQKNFKINFEKLEKILINSSSQCGRSDIIKLQICTSLEEFLEKNPNTYILDFSNKNIEDKKEDIHTLLIGCEGGFSQNERDIFTSDKIVGFKTPLILKSQTAIISASSKILI